jgi:hypothetical protein
VKARTISWAAPLALAIALARPAHAEPPASPAAALRVEARTIAEQGDELFYAGRCDKAIGLWKKADAIFHAPTLMLRVARCQALMGKVVDAAATLDAIASEPHPHDAPAPFLAAKESAKQELKRVSARIATLRLAVRVSGGGAAPVPVSVDVDGFPASPATLAASPSASADLRVDPGTHRVRLRADTTSWEREIHVEDAEVRAIDVSLWVEPPRPSASQRAIGFGVLGGGLTTLSLGIGLSLAAVSTSRSLDPACAAPACTSDPDRADRARTYTTAGTLAVASGVALTVAGAVLLSVDLRPASARVTASPTGLAFTGVF